MIKKLLLTLSFIVLTTIAFSGTTYAAQEGEKIVITEELSNLNKLYKEGVITKEEFSKAKAILLDPDQDVYLQKYEKKKKKKKKKKKLTAVQRRDAKDLEEKQLRDAKKARIKAKRDAKQQKEDDKIFAEQERERICTVDPEAEECRKTILGSLKKVSKSVVEKISGTD